MDRLILSTIHSSKGLEFDAVFVIGVADGRFPHASATFGEQWEEERRLLYVATTRAKKYLYLTYPRQLITPDRQFRRVGMSPFLSELSGGLFERVTGKPAGDRHSFAFQENFSSSSAETSPGGKKKQKKMQMTDFSVGCRVNHQFFGDGTVTKLSKARSIDIHFDRHGLKTLHLDYAQLTIL
jgi:DNA helicase-2/ATP-dependent DNA helicase PcrA